MADQRQILMKQTSRIWLNPLDNAPDYLLKGMIGWLNDPSVVRFSEQRHKIHTLESQKDYVASFSKIMYACCWGVYLGDDLIGSVSYTIDKPNNVANVGLLIGVKAHWGKGYGYEAWSRICDYLFIALRVRKIEAGCMAANHGMINICQKYGMVEEGRQSDHFLFEGKTTDLIHWGKFNETND